MHTEGVQHEVGQWVLNGRKFLTDEEIRRLKRVCALPAGQGLPIVPQSEAERGRTERERVIINLGLLAGLRVKEVADLKCGDISIGTQMSSLTVRNGKGGKMRLVRFNGELKESIMNYLKYKEAKGEESGTDDPLFKSDLPPDPPAGEAGSIGVQAGKNNKQISRRTIQRVFERMAKTAGIIGHSFHHLRHTYASHLYRASGYNLRLVQKQLGHASIKTTQVYADVFDEDLTKAVEKLYI
ncbi:MAG: tyrosine-type recombinase/integrase [Planctomycetes bacterium]|nr:tyrosine-type recombinase/integrase [Planctomycetota bacterium]